jgi:hypothetical protein
MLIPQFGILNKGFAYNKMVPDFSHYKSGDPHPVCMARNQKNSTSLTLGTQTAFDFLRLTPAGIFVLPRDSMAFAKTFQILVELCKLLAGHITRSAFKNSDFEKR